MGQEDGFPCAARPKRVADGIRSRRMTPFDVDLRDVRAVCLGDLGEPIAERADADAEDLVAR